MAEDRAMLDALLIATATAAYGALHSLLASAAVKRWFRDRFGPLVDRGYRLAYNAFAAAASLPLLALLIARPGILLYRLDLPWSAIALAGQIASVAALGVGVLQSDLRSLSGLRQWSGQRPEPQPLVVHGLYRWVRHPLYTAGLFLIWLTPVMTSGVLAFNLALTLYVLAGSRLEERRLVAEYGEAYLDYQRRVPSLLPFRLPPRR
jgi:protein-S-isoprenylcysteine O-methyltransferase Ste14